MSASGDTPVGSGWPSRLPDTDLHNDAWSRSSGRAVLSPAQKRIAAIGLRIQQKPKRAALRAELAEAYVRRNRETGDAAYLNLADKAVSQTLKPEPDSYDAPRARLSVLVARKDYTAALDLGTALNRRIPDDVAIYGLLADPEGALEWLQSAYRFTSTSESEERACLLCQMARIRRNQRRQEEAEKLVAAERSSLTSAN